MAETRVTNPESVIARLLKHAGDLMKRRLLSVVIFVCVGFFSADANRQNNKNIIAIIGATVIDGTGAEPSRQTVVVRGDRIDAVAPKIELPAGARVIDAEGLTLMPGLF